MEISQVMNAVNGGDSLKQAVGIALLSKIKDSQASMAAVMLSDFAAAQAPHPYLGKSLDLRA
ncbi:YjfB family protein [Paenibacillus filicis]|uniref:YjfB family protein n=1 Tax=Paenibacillus gyeongsangnamensis TaxID=3388067 RepID=A0ABT4Q6X3_9BACL|nr:YjfB family protein [Paenibacillus filicis]MCZ8512578.1 YjfB family protein [Paenibacillus filicis]